MRYIFFLFWAGFMGSCETAKPVSNPVDTPAIIVEDPGERINDYPLSVRLGFSPFPEAKRVDLVTMNRFQRPLQYIGQPPVPELPGKLHPFSGPNFRILSAQTLTTVQLDSITEILFNYGFGPEPKGKRFVSLCFNPRHALFFYKENLDETPFACIEICFECSVIATSPEKYFTGISCPIKFKLLKSYFRQIGITYGLDF